MGLSRLSPPHDDYLRGKSIARRRAKDASVSAVWSLIGVRRSIEDISTMAIFDCIEAIVHANIGKHRFL